MKKFDFDPLDRRAMPKEMVGDDFVGVSPMKGPIEPISVLRKRYGKPTSK